MSHPCANFSEYFESRVDSASFWSNFVRLFSKFGHPCAFNTSHRKIVIVLNNKHLRASWGPTNEGSFASEVTINLARVWNFIGGNVIVGENLIDLN